MVLAVKVLTPEYFDDWKRRHHEAALSINNREEKLDAIYEEIERDMTLIGATAIEDKLQDGVPLCIANLMLAGIKIWVLTGDKQGECGARVLEIRLYRNTLFDTPVQGLCMQACMHSTVLRCYGKTFL